MPGDEGSMDARKRWGQRSIGGCEEGVGDRSISKGPVNSEEE